MAKAIARKDYMAANSGTLTPLLNEREVATILAVSIATVRRWRLLGHGPKATKVGISVRYKPADIEEFLKLCPTIGGARSGKYVSGGGRRGHFGGVVRARPLMAGGGEWPWLSPQTSPSAEGFVMSFLRHGQIYQSDLALD